MHDTSGLQNLNLSYGRFGQHAQQELHFANSTTEIAGPDRYRDRISVALEEVVGGAASHLDPVGPWAPGLRGSLLEFANRGKLLRGSLVAVGANAFGYDPDADLFRVAAAVELVQSFLLIHDDIMDEDSMRRGAPAVFEQYRRQGERDGYTNPRRFGESMAMCGGNVSLLLAFEGIASTSFDPSLRAELIRRMSAEIADVGAAQMSDIANGHGRDVATEDEILAVYRYKTGRYTFSLPLALGGLIAGAPERDIEGLMKWGELQGTIFQLRDDRLNLMEDSVDTGKPTGSDIAADKQTLHRLKLFARAQGTMWEFVTSYFGGPVSDDQLGAIRAALEELGVLEEIDTRVDEMHAKSEVVIRNMEGLGPKQKAELTRIAESNRRRRT